MPQNVGLSYWFALNTLLVARTVKPYSPKPHVTPKLDPIPEPIKVLPKTFTPKTFTPEQPVSFKEKPLEKIIQPSLTLTKVTLPKEPKPEPLPKAPQVPTVHYHDYRLITTPEIVKEVINTDRVILHDKTVAKDSTLIYPLTVDTFSPNRVETTSLTFEDYLPAGYAFDKEKTQVDKNEMIYRITNKVVSSKNYEVINFGVYPEEINSYSYTKIAVSIALLINSKAADFVITECSSGQGMNLACNTLPGLLSAFLQNPQDAYLFGRINNGNVASLPLGLGFGWLGNLNLEYTLEKLFDGEFGSSFPPDVAERKIKETNRVKYFNKISKISLIEFLEQLEQEFIAKVLSKKDVIDHILKYSKDKELVNYLSNKIYCEYNC